MKGVNPHGKRGIVREKSRAQNSKLQTGEKTKSPK